MQLLGVYQRFLAIPHNQLQSSGVLGNKANSLIHVVEAHFRR